MEGYDIMFEEVGTACLQRQPCVSVSLVVDACVGVYFATRPDVLICHPLLSPRVGN